MTAPADPTYPLLPIATFLSAALLLLVLLSRLVNQNWSLGITFLCFWLFLQNMAIGLNSIIWSDNADVKLWVYCDIVSHLQMITTVVIPMSTFIITRRLYLIASLHAPVDRSRQRRRNLTIDWTLGLIIPLLVAGPIYYLNQDGRFQVTEGFGCGSASYGSGFYVLVVQSWTVIPPILSIAFHYPRVVRRFYRQRKDMDYLLVINGPVSRINYIRVLALASLDIFLTLPFGIMTLILVVTSLDAQNQLVFYPGWTIIHSPREPQHFRYAFIQSLGPSSLAEFYVFSWTSPVLSFTIFALFGLTAEARESYWHIVCTVSGWMGWKSTLHAEHTSPKLDTMEFGARLQDTVSPDAEMGLHPGFINADLTLVNQGAWSSSGDASSEVALGANVKAQSEHGRLESSGASRDDESDNEPRPRSAEAGSSTEISTHKSGSHPNLHGESGSALSASENEDGSHRAPGATVEHVNIPVVIQEVIEKQSI